MKPGVGIDVSKQHLDLMIGEQSEHTRATNTVAGTRKLITLLRRQEHGTIVVESTGGYERRLVDALAKEGLPVAVVNPWRVRRFAEGLGELAKTDPIDARVLARFAQSAKITLRPIPGPRQR